MPDYPHMSKNGVLTVIHIEEPFFGEAPSVEEVRNAFVSIKSRVSIFLAYDEHRLIIQICFNIGRPITGSLLQEVPS